MYQILNASRRIERELDKLPERDFVKVTAAIQGLANNPRPVGVQKLTDAIFSHSCWSLSRDLHN